MIKKPIYNIDEFDLAYYSNENYIKNMLNDCYIKDLGNGYNTFTYNNLDKYEYYNDISEIYLEYDIIIPKLYL